MSGIQEIIAKNLRERRKHLGLTQEEAAERCGISHPMYVGLEGRTRWFSKTTIAKLAHGLTMPEAAIFIDRTNIHDVLTDPFVSFHKELAHLTDTQRDRLLSFLKSLRG